MDKEFAEYQEKLNAQVEKMNQAIEQSHGEFLSEQETEELKRGYYTVMKALHPDLHPDLGPAQKTLFEKALKAYKEGDLTTMRIILEMLGTTNLPSPDEAVLPKLYQEKERLLPLVEGVKRNIAEIKGSFPYEVKDLVEDEEQVAARKAELQEIFDQYQERIEEYKKEIQAVLDNYDYIVQPQRQR
ncbi:MAG: hypothetical protein RR472_08760 [Anaerovoracaceae bacterium]